MIAIRQGRETGVDGIQALHEIGCTATLRQVKPLEDGRYDVVTVGTQRFRLVGLDDSKPYLRGQVDLLAEEIGDEAAAAQAVRVVRDGFRAYLSALAERGVTQISAPELPDDPVTLSYLVGRVDDHRSERPADAAGRARRPAPARRRAHAAVP